MAEPTRGELVCEFIEEFCRVPEGSLVGKPIELQPFQRAFILAVYDNPAVTEKGILSIARKNGKTALIAAIVLAHIAGPEAVRNSQVISGAQSRDQAAMVFDLAVKMINMDVDLQRMVHITPSKKQLIGLSKNVTYRASSAEAKTAYGTSPLLLILDELGQVEGPKDSYIDALTTGQGAHENPLILVISTQAASDADMLSVWIDDAQREKDPHIVCHVHQADKTAGLEDEQAWKAANPALGKFRSLKDMRKLAREAARMPSAENKFRNLNLNQRVATEAPFIAPSVWASCDGMPGSLEGMDVYVGLDLSEKTDLTALVLIGVDSKKVQHWNAHFWTPEATLHEREKRDRAPYSDWVKQGFLRTTPGKTIDFSILAYDIGEICAGLNILGGNYDPWHFASLQKELIDQGVELPLEPFGQTYKFVAPAINETEGLLMDGNVRHGGNPVLRWCASNAVVTMDRAGNRMLNKGKSRGRIDGIVAAVMAVMATVTAEIGEHETTFYDL